MKKPKLTQTRIKLAYAIAIIADTGKFPIFAVEATGFLAIPGAAADFAMDCFVATAATVLLGFDWALLPSLFAESRRSTTVLVAARSIAAPPHGGASGLGAELPAA